jgi:hypothetical protein
MAAPHDHDTLLAFTMAVFGFGALLRLGEIAELRIAILESTDVWTPSPW